MSALLRKMFGSLAPWRPVSGWFRRHPWIRRLLFLLPLLAVLALLGPVFGALDNFLALLGRILSPLIDTGPGRIVLAVLLLAGILLVVWRFARGRLLEALRSHGLRRLLDGIEKGLLGEGDHGAGDFRKVLRLARWVDLSEGEASAHGDLALTARLGLARLEFDLGRLDRAAASLARIPKNRLQGRQRWAHAELQSAIASASKDALPGARLALLREAHEAWPGHPRIAMRLAGLLQELGKSAEAVSVLEETAKAKKRVGGAGDLEILEDELARLHVRLAREAIASGETKLALDHCRASLRVKASDEARLLQADLQLALGELEEAVRILSDLPLPETMERIAALLEDPDRPVDERDLLLAIPRRDMLFLLARRWLSRGRPEYSMRALEVLRRTGELEPRALVLEALIHLREGRLLEAREDLSAALGVSGMFPVREPEEHAGKIGPPLLERGGSA